jgi:hypothetical protein
MVRSCRTCRYYNNKRGWCNYYYVEVPVVLDNSCSVWVGKDEVFEGC